MQPCALTDPKASEAAAANHIIEAADNVDIDTDDNMDAVKQELHVAADYGSWNLSIAIRLFDGLEADPNLVVDLFSSRTDASLPQIIGFGRKPPDQPRGRFYWGEAAVEAIDKGLVPYENIITLWKLAFYRDAADDSMTLLIQQQLDRLGLTLIELVSMHLREVVKAAKDEIRASRLSMGVASYKIDDLPIKLFLCVPVLWNSPTNRKMTEAVHKAGITQVELVLESECAAAFYSYLVRRLPPPNHGRGDKFLLADPGHGTLDMQALEYASDASDGAKVQMQNAGPAEGYLCGGRGVEENACSWLKRKAVRENGSFAHLCAYIQMSEAACLYIFSAWIEELKKKFTGPGGRSLEISLSGTDEDDGRRADMQSFFDPVINEIMGHIDTQLQRHVAIKTVVITGGFGRSRYVRQRLCNRYEPQGINVDAGGQVGVGHNLPVSRGALLRYDSIKARNLNPDEKFGVAIIEEYNPFDHHDARWDNVSIEVDDIDEVENVFARWVPLTRTHRPPATNSPDKPRDVYTHWVWQQVSLKQGERDFSLQIYWTKLDLAPHTCIRVRGARNGDLIPGVEEWGEEITFELGDQVAKDFRSVRGTGDYRGWVRQLFYRAVLEVDGANVRFKVQITNKRHQPKFENGVLNTDDVVIDDEDTLEEKDLVVADLNPCARTGV